MAEVLEVGGILMQAILNNLVIHILKHFAYKVTMNIITAWDYNSL